LPAISSPQSFSATAAAADDDDQDDGHLGECNICPIRPLPGLFRLDTTLLHPGLTHRPFAPDAPAALMPAPIGAGEIRSP
jgi:hypothetical protein